MSQKRHLLNALILLGRPFVLITISHGSKKRSSKTEKATNIWSLFYTYIAHGCQCSLLTVDS